MYCALKSIFSQITLKQHIYTHIHAHLYYMHVCVSKRQHIFATCSPYRIINVSHYCHLHKSRRIRGIPCRCHQHARYLLYERRTRNEQEHKHIKLVSYPFHAGTWIKTRSHTLIYTYLHISVYLCSFIYSHTFSTRVQAHKRRVKFKDAFTDMRMYVCIFILFLPRRDLIGQESTKLYQITRARSTILDW